MYTKMNIMQGGHVTELVPADPAVGPDAAYDAFLAEGRLSYQRCAACRAAVFPPRQHCPSCGADALGWQASSGRGTVHAASTIAPRDGEPYCVALVDLEEGYRMMTNVVGVPAVDVEIGLPVRLAIADVGAGPLPFFEVAR
jgi:uncharacterized protein